MTIARDRYIGKFTHENQQKIYREAKSIEDQVRVDDTKIREALIKSGYFPRFHPSLIDSSDLLTKRAIESQFALIGGIPNTKTYLCNEGYGLITYTSDRFGFRNIDEKWNEEVETLFIGDSFTHGACVDEQHTISNVYEQLSLKNTLNLGMVGSNPSHYLTHANIFAPKVKPKKIFFVFYPNDKGREFNS